MISAQEWCGQISLYPSTTWQWTNENMSNLLLMSHMSVCPWSIWDISVVLMMSYTVLMWLEELRVLVIKLWLLGSCISDDCPLWLLENIRNIEGVPNPVIFLSTLGSNWICLIIGTPNQDWIGMLMIGNWKNGSLSLSTLPFFER